MSGVKGERVHRALIGPAKDAGGASESPCYTPGTLIATPQGERAVETLGVGDRVLTRDNGPQAIRWSGRRMLRPVELAKARHLAPVTIRKGALGEGLPERDLVLSPQHRVLVGRGVTQFHSGAGEVLVAAKSLVRGPDARAAMMGVIYVHFLCDRHEVVLANGAWSESFEPSDQSLQGLGAHQRAEILELFPSLRSRAGAKVFEPARHTVAAAPDAVLINR